MKVTERTVLLSATGLLLVAAFAVAIFTGELAGFQYPGSEAVHAVVFSLCGAVILGAHPGHTVGRLLMWSGFGGAVAQLIGQFDPDGLSVVLFATWGLALASIARFPDGDWVNRWARRFAYGVVAAFALQAFIWWAAEASVMAIWGAGPAASWVAGSVQESPWLVAGLTLAGPLGFGLLASTVVGMWRLVRGDPVRTRQVAVVILGGVLVYLLGLPTGALEDARSPWAGVLNSLSLVVFPVSVMVAIVRYRLYEIDRVLSRTLSYGIILGLMVAVFATVSLGLGVLLGGTDDLTVAIATLAAVAATVPLGRRIRRWVDRRFFRSRYDAAAVVARVADELRATVDIDAVEARAEAVIDEVFAPESVGVWVAGRT
jgi:hypothetical protein